ncbi:MAG: zinc ribbon domain-containing protein [Thermanaerothrix sp.]|nr:zinc ribbon domain-containing protein [Thermanaerothrix sp.]
MELGALFFILALALLVGFYLSQPLFDPRWRRVSVAAQTIADSRDHLRSSLLAERDRLINALLELEFDYALGKIPEEDYPAQREAMRQAAVQVLRQLDELEVHRIESGVEERLEAALAARRAQRKSEVLPEEMDDIERLIAERRRERQGKVAGFCPHCGQPIRQEDRFCPKCGTALKGDE